MKLLYGTGNPAKAAAMQNRIAGLDIELISLQDLRAQGVEIPNVPETGNTPLENARQKAHAYYEAFRMPVFSCDSGLYFEDVPEAVQPGVHVRTVNGVYLTDGQSWSTISDWSNAMDGLRQNTAMPSAMCRMRNMYMRQWSLTWKVGNSG